MTNRRYIVEVKDADGNPIIEVDMINGGEVPKIVADETGVTVWWSERGYNYTTTAHCEKA